MKVALVHDWLTGMRGGEKVLEQLCELFPTADLYTLVHIKGSVSPIIENRRIHTSFIQHLPDIERSYRYYLPLMPTAIRKFYLSKYDVVLSSSHCVAKGIRIKKGTLHICYCHTPMRYIWDMYEGYFGNSKFHIKLLMRVLRGHLQKWDVNSSQNVHFFIANSENVKKRIQKYYKRKSDVIYPPVDTDFFTLPNSDNKKNTYYLIVSAFAPYKKIDLAIKAFKISGGLLKIVSSGQEEKRLRAIATDNIEFSGWLSQEDLRKYYQNSKAVIFPGEEDFGITPLEAMSSGKPVIAYGKGGILETVIDGKTGILFHEQNVDSVIGGIKKFEEFEETFNSQTIREHAIKFNMDRFRQEFTHYFNDKINEFFD